MAANATGGGAGRTAHRDGELDSARATKRTLETISLERDGDVEVLTLNRPERLNALNPRMVEELLAYFAGLEVDELLANTGELSPRVIVIKGAGRAFCAGLDLAAGATPKEGLAQFNFQRRISQIVVAMRRVKQPIISLVHGPACGFGFAVMLASDVRIATRDARFNVAMSKIGLTGGDIGISYFLPRVAGPSLAAELMMTGDFLHAERAHQLGIVSSVHESQQEMVAAGLALARRMTATMTPLALFMTKEVLKHSMDASGLEACVAMEDRQQLLQLGSEDFKVLSRKVVKGANL